MKTSKVEKTVRKVGDKFVGVLRGVGTDAWDEIKTGIDKAWDEIKLGVDDGLQSTTQGVTRAWQELSASVDRAKDAVMASEERYFKKSGAYAKGAKGRERESLS